MSIETLATALLAVALVGLLMARQLRWRAFDPARALRLPVVLAAVGLVQLANLHAARLTAVDGALLAVELLLSVGIGVVMGRVAVFRPAPDGSGALQVRGRWIGASLWLGLVAVRIAFDALGASLGAHLLTQTGVILVLIAASRGTAALVTRAREPQPALRSA